MPAAARECPRRLSGDRSHEKTVQRGASQLGKEGLPDLRRDAGLGDGTHMLPVKLEIRRRTGKDTGDRVAVVNAQRPT